MPKYHLLNIFVIILLGFLIYSTSLPNQFVWDDEFGIQRNFLIRNGKNIFLVFRNVLYPGVSDAHNFYRPLQNLTYLVDYAFWQLNPRGYHLTNVSLHLLAVLSLYWFIYLLTRKRNLALAISLIFLVHPVHTAAVAYISGRADPLSLIFFLVSFSFYLLYRRKNQKFLYILSLFSFLLSMFAKESVILFPLLLYGFSLYFAPKKNFSWRRELVNISGFILVILAYLVLRHFWVGIDIQSKTWLAQTPLALRALTAFRIMGIYVGLLFFPHPLYMERRLAFSASLFENNTFFGFLLVCFLLWLVLFLRRKKPLAGFGLFWFLISIVPVLNIFVPLNAMLAEHWLYFPSIGFFIFAVSLAQELIKPKWLKVTLTSGILLSFSILSARQNFIWRDDLTVYAHTVRFAPYSARAQNNLGRAFLEHKKFSEAEAQFKKALALDPNHVDAHNNLGNLYSERKEFHLAKEEFKKALTVDPDNIAAHVNLGVIYRDEGRLNEAETEFKAVFKINDTVPEAHNNLGNILAQQKRFPEAIKEYQRALELGLEFAEIYANLGFVYQELKQYQNAQAQLEKAHRMKPELPGLADKIAENKKYLQLVPGTAF